MGSYGSYRVQALVADIVFSKGIDVEALVSDRYTLVAVERAIAPSSETYKIVIYP